MSNNAELLVPALAVGCSNAGSLPAAHPGTLDGYIAYVHAIPLLSEEEELGYARELHQNGSMAAAHRLVLANLRYVVQVAKKYLGYGLPLADLIQEGTIGLMKAVKKFDPNKKVRLVTFALHWIKADIHEFILRNWRIVKVATTKAQRKLFFKLRSKKTATNWLNQEEIKTIAKDLNVKTSDVVQMEQRMYGTDYSFEAPEETEKENESFLPINYLEAETSNPEHQISSRQLTTLHQANLQKALATLDDRSKDIVLKRWFDGVTLQSLAASYNISKERIRQIEKQAILKLRQYF